MFAVPTTALDINSSNSLRYFPDSDQEFGISTEGEITAYGNTTLNQNSIEDLNRLYGDTSGGNFFQDACSVEGQVIEGINSDGTYSCVDPSEDVEVENLSETLAAGNVANQSIEFDSSTGIVIGDDSSSTNYPEDIAIGRSASASGVDGVSVDGWAVALGQGSDADNSATALGTRTAATGDGSTAIGGGEGVFNGAQATGQYSIAIGTGTDVDSTPSTASAQGSVAIGPSADAPNPYEATFGDLGNNKLDVNITGNATIHGEDLDLKNGDIENFFDQDKCGESQAVKTVYPNGSYECNPITTDQTVENLSQTLEAGNVANQSIDMSNNNVSAVGNLVFDSSSLARITHDSNSGGIIQIQGSPSTVDFGAAGPIEILGGEGSGNTVDGGNIYIDGGAGSGENGAVFIGTDGDGSDASRIAIGTTGSKNDFVDIAGNISMKGNSINDIDTLTGNSGAINVRNNLDLQGQNLSNYFGNACNDGNAATGVYDNGTIQCTDAGNFGTDNQDLQYSVPSSEPTSEYKSQEIGIENGTNITGFRDYYEPDDQSLSMNGQQLSLDNGGQLYVTYANNSDTVDGSEASYLNTTIDSITNSDQTQTITLSNGDSATFTDNVDDADADPNNELQNLSEVLVNGNVANQSIDLNDNSIDGVSSVDGNGDSINFDDNLDTSAVNITAGGNVTIGTDLRVWGDIWTRGDVPAENLSETLDAGNSAGSNNIDLNNNNIQNVNQISGNSEAIDVSNDVNMSQNNVNDAKSVQFGGGPNGERLVKQGGDLCLGDEC